MTGTAWPLSPDDLRLLAEIGFIGTETGQHAAARAIFSALLTLRPGSTLPHIGLAMADLAADRPEDAVRYLRDEGLKQHPEDGELMAFFGLALQCAGQNAEARKVLSRVMEQKDAGNEPHLRMAEKLLAIGQGGVSLSRLIPRWSEQDRTPASP